MRHSTRVKLTMIFIGLMAAVLVSMWTVNNFFLESFYIEQELRLLENTYENPDAITVDKEFQGQNITEELQSLFSSDGEQTEASRLLRLMNSRYNTTIMIQNSIIGELIPLVRDGKFLADAFYHYTLRIIDPRAETPIPRDDHQVQKIYDGRLQGYYLQNWGFFDDNRTTFIISTPLASIHDSANTSNELLACVGLAALALGSTPTHYVIEKVVSSICSLAALPVRMSELDFEARYTGDSEDEIEALDHNMNTLSEKLEETTDELETANNELQKDIEEEMKIDETRKGFIVNVSHELKTPIVLIQGYTEGLIEGMAEDEDNCNYHCEVITDETGRMNKMMKQLLTLTALEFGNDIPVIERFNIAALVRGILSFIGILFQQKEIRVAFNQEGPIWMWADEFKIEEVTTNYLNSAMNHLGGERRIEIRLERKEKEVHITVSNTGRHIPEEDLGSLWIKFYKIDKARMREYGGSDIGLSIVKATMDSHNKPCDVKNVNEGVGFWFTADSGI